MALVILAKDDQVSLVNRQGISIIDPQLSTQSPLMRPKSVALINIPLSNSITIISEEGDTGSLCLKPLVDLKISEAYPSTIIEKQEAKMH